MNSTPNMLVGFMLIKKSVFQKHLNGFFKNLNQIHIGRSEKQILDKCWGFLRLQRNISNECFSRKPRNTVASDSRVLIFDSWFVNCTSPYTALHKIDLVIQNNVFFSLSFSKISKMQPYRSRRIIIFQVADRRFYIFLPACCRMKK